MGAVGWEAWGGNREVGSVSGGDVVLIVLAVASLGLAATSTAVLVAVRSATRDLRAAARELADVTERARAAATDGERTAAAAADQSARIEELLVRSDGVIDRVDAASELAHQAFGRPVIKAMAVGAGTRQAVRRLRGRSEGEGDDQR